MQYIRIRNLREDMDMTQTDMAKVLFISQRTYSYYESGGHDIPTEVLVRIADFYQVSVDYLLNRTDKREMNHRHLKKTALAACAANAVLP